MSVGTKDKVMSSGWVRKGCSTAFSTAAMMSNRPVGPQDGVRVKMLSRPHWGEFVVVRNPNRPGGDGRHWVALRKPGTEPGPEEFPNVDFHVVVEDLCVVDGK